MPALIWSIALFQAFALYTTATRLHVSKLLTSDRVKDTVSDSEAEHFERSGRVKNSTVAATSEVTVTVWNIISYQKSKNAFEFAGPKDKVSLALRRTSDALLNSDILVKTYLRDVNLRKLLKRSGKWPKDFRKATSTPATRYSLTDMWKTVMDLKIKDFLKVAFPSSLASKVDYMVGRRPGFNDYFVCDNAPIKNKPKAEGAFSVKDVFYMALFDTIMEKVVNTVKKSLGHEEVERKRVELCAKMFGGVDARITDILDTLELFGTDVAVLQEIPPSWFSKLGASSEWTVRHPSVASRHPADNTVLLFRTSSFESVDVAIEGLPIHGDHTYKAKILAAAASPVGFHGKKVSFMGAHLSSKKTENRQRQLAIAEMLDRRLTRGNSVIAASDTNGDPRQPAYESGAFFYEQELARDPGVFRATDAPWGTGSPTDTPAFGTCNKMRTAMQAQVKKANKADRLMKDNIYFKSAAVSITQKDLCSSDCSRFTFSGALSCFRGGRKGAALVGPQGTTFPKTCGYLGASTTLPDPLQAYGVSDHAPVSARFRLYTN